MTATARRKRRNSAKRTQAVLLRRVAFLENHIEGKRMSGLPHGHELRELEALVFAIDALAIGEGDE